MILISSLPLSFRIPLILSLKQKQYKVKHISFLSFCPHDYFEQNFVNRESVRPIAVDQCCLGRGQTLRLIIDSYFAEIVNDDVLTL